MARRGKLSVRVIAPDRIVYEGEAESVVYPAGLGLAGVLPGHAPMITTVEVGILEIRENPETTKKLVVMRGFCEVGPAKVHLVVDAGERPEEIDLRRAEEAERRARHRLGTKAPDVDVARAEYALRRALTRRKAAAR